MPAVDIRQHSGTIRPILMLALPALAEEFLNLLVGYTDWWLVGHFLPGPEYQAAMSVMAYMLWLVPSMFSAIAIGATALTARYVGAGDRSAAQHVVNQAMTLGILLAGAATALAWFGGAGFVRMLQLDGRAAELAASYLKIITLVIPLVMIEQVAVASLRGAGDTMSGLLVKIIVNTVNVTVSAGLLIGWGPLPKMGWYGVAIGTAAGHCVGALILLSLLIRGRGGLRLQRHRMVPDHVMIKRLLAIGVPGGIDVLIVIACHLTYLSIINSLGTLAAASHGLTVQIEAMAYLPGGAFSIAAATLCGQCLGARDVRRAMRGAYFAVAGGGTIMLCAGAMFYWGGRLLTQFFMGDAENETAILATQLLRIGAFSVPAMAVVSIFSGALRGAGDTKWPLAFTLCGFLFARLPLALWMAWPAVPIPLVGIEIEGLDWGVRGAWIAMLFDLYMRAGLILARFHHSGWRRVSPEEPDITGELDQRQSGSTAAV